MVIVRSSKKLTGMYILQGRGSNRAICISFLLPLSVTLQKITAERNCYGEKLKTAVQSCSEGAVKKVIHFEKFPKIGNAGGRVLLLVKFHILLYKNDSTKGVLLETSESFQNTQASQILDINIFNAQGNILSMPYICFYEGHIS